MLRHESSSRQDSAVDSRWIELLDAAARVFSAEGYEGASMRRIASDAKLSLSGIYHYVAGKEELLYWIQLNTFDSLLHGLQDSIVGVDDPRERIHAAVLNHVRHFGEHIHELKVCARELSALEGGAYREVHERRYAYFKAVHDLVKAVPPKPDAPLDPWLATANLFGMLNWFYQWYDPDRSPVSVDDLATQQTALFLGGYAASHDDNRSDR